MWNLPCGELLKATHGFGDASQISGGASCAVFTGALFGLRVAVKRLTETADAWSAKQFQSVMDTLCAVSHECICRLFAYSVDGPRRCLVLELCTGGSLDVRLACARGEAPLQWDHRLRIAVAIGRALEHLHCLDPPLLHRDVKSANVLLDAAGNAKVADFGE